jgi:hypothetical protein
MFFNGVLKNFQVYRADGNAEKKTGEETADIKKYCGQHCSYCN